MNNIKKIKFPLQGFNISGGLRIIIHIANGLSKKGHSVSFIVPDYAAEPPFDLADNINVKILHTRGKGIWRKLYYILKLCFISVCDSDICFATGYKTPYYIYISKLINRSSTKLIYLIQGYEPLSHVEQSGKNYLAKKILFALAILSYRLPFKKIAVSNWIKEKIGKRSVSVIGNGIDVNLFSPGEYRKKTDEFIAGAIGGKAQFKGYDVFLKGIQAINSGHKTNMKVLMASQQAPGLPVGVKAELIKPGNDGEMVEFYRRCDIFVFTSFIEGFGLPPLEAMACGLPVITTDCGGVRDFANDENAIIVPPGDPMAVAAAIIQLKKDENLRMLLSIRGLETAHEFSIEKMIAQYCSFVEGI